MPTKRAVYPVELKASGDEGQVEALVSIFGNVDLQGDRVMPGAFKKSIAEWKQSGDPVPVVFSHDWGDVWSHIGVVDTLEETPKGLRALYTLDIADNPAAAQTFKLLKRRSIKEHSFAYDVVQEHRAKDGANELTELKVIEVGPTLKGANPDTELVAVKAMIAETAPADTDLDALIDGAKAGRRLSQATQTELQAISDDLESLRDRMHALMGSAEDEPKSADEKSAGPEDDETEGAADGDTDSEEIEDQDDETSTEGPTAKSTDPSVLELRTRISEMRATTGIPA